MNNLVALGNDTEGCKVGQIRSQGNNNFYFHGYITWTSLKRIENFFGDLDLIFKVTAGSKRVINTTKC